ncbi:hypothetical protein MMC07_008430 [Pseudocyphellaria aurata]|nr:hypothetical protein [Pseudocyphellaria aurata]
MTDDQRDDKAPGSYPKAPRLVLTTPRAGIARKETQEAGQERGPKKPQGTSRQRRHKKEQRRRDGADPSSSHLAQLPSELLLNIMHHMDKSSVKSFVLSAKRMHDVREANTMAVFKGMQRERFPGYLSAFGDPTKKSEEQAKMALVAGGSDWCRVAPRLCHHDPRSLWWQHLMDLSTVKENVDAETTALRNLPGGDKFDAALSRDAILLQWHLGLRMAQITEDAGQQTAQMFLSQPAEIQLQLLKIGQFLGAKIENHAGLAAIAGCWARLDVHLPEVDSLEETKFVRWISARVTAYTVAAIFRRGPRGVAKLLECAKDSSQLRFDFVELLVNDQAQPGEGWFDMEMMIGHAIGFHALNFANTMQQVESQLLYWRSQSADNHMIHLKRFLGFPKEN